MAKITFQTEVYTPDLVVVIRAAQTGWTHDHGGVYENGVWNFELEDLTFAEGIEFKFLVQPNRWMTDPNIVLSAAELAASPDFNGEAGYFPERSTLLIEHGEVARQFFSPNFDQHEYDVIVVGSGMGGGLLASTLANMGADVLLLEAGSYLFPTHVGNLPRRLLLGQFDKHIWSIWHKFGVKNYVNAHGSDFKGLQGFNFGGRSIFWGGLIPRMAEWELAAWPAEVQEYLGDSGTGYLDAEQALNYHPPATTQYQADSKTFLESAADGFTASDAPVAAQYTGYTAQSIPAGVFSSADRLLEDILAVDATPPRTKPTINLNQAVHRVLPDPTDGSKVIGVEAYDLLARTLRTYYGQRVVLAAGTIESAKIALLSKLTNPADLIGRGMTDHTIRFRHFTLPPGSAQATQNDSAKVLLRHSAASPPDAYPFAVVVEFGADHNQGRYADPADLRDEVAMRGGRMIGELVFMYYAELVEGNTISLSSDNPSDPVRITVNPATPSTAAVQQADELATAIFAKLEAEPVEHEDTALTLETADLGGVAHEVGTLRMGVDSRTSVVDANLRFHDYDNLFACDNSVFPVSPAANPSLTLAALALRLGEHLKAP